MTAPPSHDRASAAASARTGDARATDSSKGHIRQLLGWLGDSKNQLQLALDAADLGIWHRNLSTGEVLWCPRCRSLLGVAADTPASVEKFLSLVHSDDRARVASAIDTALRSGDSFSEEFRIVLSSGAIRWLHSLGRAQYASDGSKPSRWSGVVRDVTEDHRAREAKAKEQQYRQQLLMMAPVGVAKFDRNMRFLIANERFVQGLRLGDQALAGRSLYEVLPEIPQAWRERHQQCLAGATLHTAGEALQRLDGSVDWVSSQIYPWHDEHNEIGGILLAIDILTQRRHIEALERLWTSSFTHNTHGMVIVDPSTGTISSANPACGRLLGYSPDELPGRSVWSLCPETEHLRLREVVERSDASGSSSTECLWLHRDGTSIPTALKLVSVRNAEGAVQYHVAIITDLRERAASDRFHSQFRSLAQRLDHLRDLERSELAYSLRTGFNDDLTTLKTGLATLSDSSDVGELAQGTLRQFAELADATLERLRHIIFDLVPPGIEELGFAGALERYIGEYAARSGLQITLSVPEALVQVPQQIAAVLYGAAQEALGNAIRHAHATRVDLSVTVNDGTVRLRVIDNGIGIGEKDRNKPGCFGLLATSERLAQIGGTLRTLGAVSQGTTFEASAPIERRRRQRGSLE
jgi:PAS domain S-box-containing protein